MGRIGQTWENPDVLKNPRVMKKRSGVEQEYNLIRLEGSGQHIAKGHSAAEVRLVRSGKMTTVRPCPYYLKSRLKEPEGIPEEQRNTGIESLPQYSLRRGILNMEAIDGDLADRSA
ncbi:uncharacterized protein TNCV_2065361 [Trichonephila clavipes]|nr:uncharacterized protein TNCV_2065361 [Trichonephila clavipes]